MKNQYNWLNNEILRQAIKSCMEKTFDQKLYLFINKNFSLDKMIHFLISWIDGRTNELIINSGDELSAQFQELMDDIPAESKWEVFNWAPKIRCKT